MPSMLSEKEMDQASAQLANFRTDNERHQSTLSEMLDKYTTLVEDYKRLKSDYEEERDSRERYKQMARGQERNPFVLVLVDGDGYIFDDDLISAGAEGGQRAAHLLRQTVKDSLRNRGLEHCQIMVRIYANLSGLSKALSRAKLVGPEKRSLPSFAANFNRSNELFDFVDAGELKENADFKIRAMFRLFAENAQCKHIFFAGCHDIGYISELTPYVGNRDRITLVRSTSYHQEFSKLGLRTESFQNIFRLSSLDTFVQMPPKILPTRAAEPTIVGPMESAKICKFHQKGDCSYGSKCRNLHIPRNAANGASPGHSASDSLAEGREWRQNGAVMGPSVPFSMSNINKNDNDFFMGSRNTNETPAHTSHDFSSMLPRQEDIPAGDIAVNKKQHRLDAYLPPVSTEDCSAFNARTAQHKLCNNYHLTGTCQSSGECQYDHSPISPGVMKYLQQIARSLPCSRRGGCRLTACTQGHICQKRDCKHRGGKTFCKIPMHVHTQDLNVAQYVPGIAQQTHATDENDDYTTTSRKGSPPFLLRKESTLMDSDEEKQDGAPLDANHMDYLD